MKRASDGPHQDQRTGDDQRQYKSGAHDHNRAEDCAQQYCRHTADVTQPVGVAPPGRPGTATRPVKVSAITAVVRSEILCCRMVALQAPMAIAVRTIIKNRRVSGLCVAISNPIETPAAIHSGTASISAAANSQRRNGLPAKAFPVRPATRAPARKAVVAIIQPATWKCGVPATANPRKTMLPVMFAVNTLPTPSTLIASTKPVVTESTKSSQGRGISCREAWSTWSLHVKPVIAVVNGLAVGIGTSIPAALRRKNLNADEGRRCTRNTQMTTA
jgi:hypothetical protein